MSYPLDVNSLLALGVLNRDFLPYCLFHTVVFSKLPAGPTPLA